MKKQSEETTDLHVPLVSRIDVDNLFFTYSYKLETKQSVDDSSGYLMLLYGKNGTGKTTVLNLLYHLLHPEPYGGHRSELGVIPFSRFKVYLFNDITVSASRPGKADAGAYEIRASNPANKQNIEWSWNPKDRVQSVKKDTKYRSLCEFLGNLDLTFHYLRDTRRVEGTAQQRATTLRRIRGPWDEDVIIREAIENEVQEPPEKQLQSSIEAATQWFRQKALSATNIGYTSVNTIYRDIIKNIVQRTTSSTLPDKRTDQLMEALIQLGTRNSDFAKFGITPELEIDDILQSLHTAKPEHVNMLSTVLGPYLDGHKARLDALQELQDVMNSFVTLLAQFYSHKRVSMHLQRGLHIDADTGHELEPRMLSSGEKQLLLLFCNAISARSDRTILMIDEPELSLNVAWQRDLIRALLTCMSGTAFQIILATHSVELLSQYPESVTPLENLRKSNG
jgi:energy-coupling factor transporter ATP-binding protein EcfA2